jgi:6-phosphogluconolactonase
VTVRISRRAWMTSTLLAALAIPLAARVAQRDRLVFVGTYTGPSSRGIYAFRFNDTTGVLEPLGLAAETPSPSFLTASADGRFLFAVNETNSYNGERSGSVTSFAIDAAAGRLKPISVQSTGGAAPCHLALDATERVLAVANYTGGTFVLLPVDNDGRLGPAAVTLTSAGSGPNRARQDGPHPQMVLFDATNRFLLGTDLGSDRVLVYRFDPTTPALTTAHAAFDVPPGSGPRHLAFHPTEPLLFAVNELTSTVSTFIWDEAAGVLEGRGDEPTLPDGYADPNAAAGIVVHPNGRFLYASNRGHDSITCWGLSSDGQFALIDHAPTRGRTPRHFTIAPSGRWLVAANQNSESLAVFSIDEGSGRLAPAGDTISTGSPVCVLFAP